MITLLYRYAGSPKTSGRKLAEFRDNAKASRTMPGGHGMGRGEQPDPRFAEDGTIRPQSTTTRADFATIAVRFTKRQMRKSTLLCRLSALLLLVVLTACRRDMMAPTAAPAETAVWSRQGSPGGTDGGPCGVFYRSPYGGSDGAGMEPGNSALGSARACAARPCSSPSLLMMPRPMGRRGRPRGATPDAQPPHGVPQCSRR